MKEFINNLRMGLIGFLAGKDISCFINIALEDDEDIENWQFVNYPHDPIFFYHKTGHIAGRGNYLIFKNVGAGRIK